MPIHADESSSGDHNPVTELASAAIQDPSAPSDAGTTRPIAWRACERRRPRMGVTMSAHPPTKPRRPMAHVAPGRYQYTQPVDANDIAALIRTHDIEIVDLRFTDLPGLWQHFSITVPEV